MSHGTADTSDAVSGPDRPDGDRSASTRRGSHAHVPERMWAYDFSRSEAPLTDDLADPAAGPTRHGSIRTALRRRAWLWCATTVLGLLIGLGLYVTYPPGYQASTSVMLAYSSDQNVADASVTDLSLAKSHSVAEGALRQLGLKESLASFMGSVAVTAPADRIILFTVTAPSTDAAVARANALAAEYLQLRSALLENQQRLVFAALSNQLSHITPATVPGLAAAIANYQATAQVDMTSTVNGSTVLNVAAPIRRSLRKTVTDPGGGLLGGLALGMAIVIVDTLVSDRPRRRDDVARALGAPVRLSVGRIRVSRWLPGRRGLAPARGAKIWRITEFLRSVVPPRTRGPAALAVIPVGDARVAALSMVSLALSYARAGLKVVVADLYSGAPAARLLRAKAPGVREVNVQGVPLTVVVPDRDDVVPVGPLGGDLDWPAPDEATDPVAAACGQADLLLTLADPDPALGAEHLRGWAAEVVVIVTAGRCSSPKIHVVSEMIRLAGLSLISGVLVGVDRADESLGLVPSPDQNADQVSSVPVPDWRGPAGA
jgi:capsular polysaccharide biosynthesis protein